ncbi:hypothetical protein MKX03_027109 [Papaver bracteatum]|nr:hypothetical protein MKX03_027109 [Papaver bracteatum]
MVASKSTVLLAGLMMLAMVSATYFFNMVDAEEGITSSNLLNVKAGGESCCINCSCDYSYPPQCRCDDRILFQCNPGCNECLCTKSYPAQCHCTDVISTWECPRCPYYSS